MKYKIRVANENDCEVLNFLFARLLENDRLYDSNIKEELTMKGFFNKRILELDSIILVAIIDDLVVGYIYGYIRRDNKIKIELEAYIESLYVVKEYRNNGIGTELISKLIENVKKQGVKYLFIENKVTNESPKRIYSKLNFDLFIENRRKEI